VGIARKQSEPRVGPLLPGKDLSTPLKRAVVSQIPALVRRGEAMVREQPPVPERQ